jgi:ech hydrogenase subunit C
MGLGKLADKKAKAKAQTKREEQNV